MSKTNLEDKVWNGIIKVLIYSVTILLFVVHLVDLKNLIFSDESSSNNQVLVTTQSAGLNNFTISQFDFDYYLDKDTEGRSILRVVENITVDFPNFQKNKGLSREIPKYYQGHPLSFELLSLKRNNQPEPIYRQYEQGSFHVIETGTDEYVLGSQTYTFTYTLRDVTHYFPDMNRDELYGNTNGTQWRVPIMNLTARVHMSEDLRSRFTGDMKCYRGTNASTDQCDILQTDTGFITSTTNLLQNENLTFVIGFEPDSFTPYQETWLEKMFPWYYFSLIFTSIIGFLGLLFISRRFEVSKNRKNEITTIIPEYIPPKNVSIRISASIIDSPRSVFTAQLIDLAVRGYIQIIETKQKTFWKKAEFAIKIVRDINELKEEEQEILIDMFGTFGIYPKVGEQLSLKTLHNNMSFLEELKDNAKKLKKLVEQYGFREKNETESLRFKKLAILFLVLGILTLSPMMLGAGIIAWQYSRILRPLTDKGLELYRYLKGLKMYIKVAEKDRIKMLQSPDGVEKIGSDITGDTDKLLKFYEQTLPYAILFGQEKEWNKQLGKYYESTHTAPNWYYGTGHFINTTSFNSLMNNLSNSINTTSSSVTGGSGGGGFSGGGFGGGGGGGR